MHFGTKSRSGPWVLMFTIAVAASPACGDDDDDSVPDGGLDGGAGSGANGGSGGTGGSGGSGATDAGGDAGDAQVGDAGVQLSDAQIAQVMMIANVGEVQEGQVALMRASATSVHGFGDRMVTEHTDANDMLNAVVQSQSITPASSAPGQQLMHEATREVTKLKRLSGSAFDSEYMNAQVKDHRQVLALIDSTLLPQVSNTMLLQQLKTMRLTVRSHLMAAENIVDMLEGDGGAEDGGI